MPLQGKEHIEKEEDLSWTSTHVQESKSKIPTCVSLSVESICSVSPFMRWTRRREFFLACPCRRPGATYGTHNFRDTQRPAYQNQGVGNNCPRTQILTETQALWYFSAQECDCPCPYVESFAIPTSESRSLEGNRTIWRCTKHLAARGILQTAVIWTQTAIVLLTLPILGRMPGWFFIVASVIRDNVFD